MKKWPLLLLVSALVAMFSLRCAAAAVDESEDRFLALGDSLATGVGASDPTTTAYVPLFHQFLLAEEGEDTVLINLGHSGDTSSTLISHGHLAAAVTQIESGDVAVVTVDIGGNDVIALLPICSEGLTPPCLTAVNDAFATFSVLRLGRCHPSFSSSTT